MYYLGCSTGHILAKVQGNLQRLGRYEYNSWDAETGKTPYAKGPVLIGFRQKMNSCSNHRYIMRIMETGLRADKLFVLGNTAKSMKELILEAATSIKVRKTREK